MTSPLAFWVGTWDVHDTATGERAGFNEIVEILDGHAVLERWTGASGLEGASLFWNDGADSGERRRRVERVRRSAVPSARDRHRAAVSLITESERAGFWTLEARVVDGNDASLRLHLANGFRVVGVRERIGCWHGAWCDVLLLERRSRIVG